MYKYKCKLVRVVDGDTADVMIDLGFDTWIKSRLRFKGVDTWEKRTRDKAEKVKGLAATAFTKKYLEMNDGNFTIQADVGDVLSFSYVGYETFNQEILNQDQLLISLNP